MREHLQCLTGLSQYDRRCYRVKASMWWAVTASALGAAIAIPLILIHTAAAVNPAATPVSAHDTDILINAEQLLIGQCMHSHGFKYWQIPAARVYPVPNFVSVVTSVSQAKRSGFGETPETGTGNDQNMQYFNHLRQRQQKLYSDSLLGLAASPPVMVRLPSGGIIGHSSTGCQAAAATELYGNYQTWFGAHMEALYLPAIWQLMVLKGHSYQTAASYWSACMRTAGYNYSTPGQAYAAFREENSGQPSRRAIQAAVAEAVCANRTGFDHTTARLDRLFAAEVNKRYWPVLNMEWRLERRALPHAELIVKSRPNYTG
jgi:hypothetical protein